MNGECYLLNNSATCNCTGTGYTGINCTKDVENPDLLCPANFSTTKPFEDETKTVQEFNVTVEDNSGEVLVITSDFPANGTFSIGRTVVTYQAVDSSGNIGMCTVIVNIQNILCPISDAISTDDGLPTAEFNYTVAVSDNTLTPQCSTPSGFLFPIGATVVECTVMDSSISAACNFTVLVEDIEPPVIECPNDVFLQSAVGVPSLTATWNQANATDNSQIAPNITSTYRSGDPFPVGSTEVTYDATDVFGNSASCLFNVTIEAYRTFLIEMQFIEVDGLSYIFSEALANASSPDYLSLVSKLCNSVSSISDLCEVNFFTNGSVTVHFEISFSQGTNYTEENLGTEVKLAASREFNITYIKVTDLNTPTLVCPVNQQYLTDDGCFVDPNFDVNGTDHISNLLIATCTPMTFNNTGNFSVTCSVTDMANNVASCSFFYTVSDVTPPNVACPKNITVDTDVGVNTAAVIWNSAVVTDNCCGDDVNLYSNATNGTEFHIGNTIVAFIAMDCNDNQNECLFSIEVEDNETPVLNCPPNQNVSGDSDCMASATWMPPNVTDNSGDILTPMCDYVSGSTFSDYSTIVTCNVTDNFDNTDYCAFKITIYDDEDPVLFCPADITVCALSGSIISPIFWESINTTDNCCDNVNITSNYTSGKEFEIGEYVVTYTATDCWKNSASCNFSIVVLDCDAPVLECSQDLEFNADHNCNSYVNWTEVKATDNHDSDVTVFCNQSEGIYSLDNYTVNCNATDIAGNTGYCSFNFYVIGKDITSPMVSCPHDITDDTDMGMNTAALTWDSAVATDNCCGDNINLYSNATNGTSFYIGLTKIAFTAVDCYGNRNECVFSITVEDNEAPILECSLNQNLRGDSVCMATATWMLPNVTDNSGDNLTPVCDSVSGSTFSDYNTIVTCNATDNYGNTGSCTFSITIYDETAPILTCPDDIEVCTGSGIASANATWESATATDNCCSDVNIISNYTSGDSLLLGVYTVGYAATDCNGNTGYCQFTVIVKDCEPPALECPRAQYVAADENCLGNVTWTAPIVTDNSGDSFIAVCDYVNGSTFSYLSTIVTCSATDNYDNTNYCTFESAIYDDKGPVIFCPTDISICATTGYITTSVSWESSNATDNCCKNISITSNYTSGDEFEIGENLVTYTATDCDGNSASCNFTVAVLDCEAPILNCSLEFNVDASETCLSYVNWTDVTATDNYDNDVIVYCNQAVGIFPLDNYTVNCNATDKAGNTGNCYFNFHIFDVTAPILVCPGDITVDTDVGINTVAVTWDSAVVTDNCCSDDINVSFNNTNGTDFSIGITSVAYTAVDCYGNQDECVFNIKVEDNEAPIIECPQNQNLTGDSDCMATTTWMPPNATDNSGDNLTIVCDYISGSTFFDYSTIVTCNAMDSYDNIENCTFAIIIYDEDAPNITCPEDIEVCTDPGIASVNVTWEEVNVTDNCCSNVTNYTSNYTNGDPLSIGTYTVGYTATDCNENTGYCHFTVEVKDCEPPVPKCPASQSVAGDENCLADVTWIEPTVTDNSEDVFIPVCDYLNGTTFSNVSTTIVTCSATDNHNNTANCNFTVTVYDDKAPAISCPADIDVCAATGHTTAHVYWKLINATDNCCDSLNITSTYIPGDEFEIGETVVTYTATDCSVNSALCNFTIVVFDCEAPVLNCSLDFSVDANETCFAYVNWTDVTATDNYDSNLTVFCDLSEGIFPLDNYTVNCNATDMAGNTGTCFFNFYIVDVIPPVLMCPGDITVGTEVGVNTSSVTWDSAVVTDNCCGDDISFSSNIENGTAFYIGNTEVTFVAVECNGNQNECVFNITVYDTEEPLVECPQDQNLTADSNCTATTTWISPKVIDNSGKTFGPLCDFVNGSTFLEYNTIVTCNATDNYDNTGNCTFSITIYDQEDPVIVCPTDIRICALNGLITVPVYWNPTNATDNCCDNISITSNYTSGDEFEIGEYLVAYTATDCWENSAVYCEAPVLNCSNDFSVYSNETCFAYVNWTDVTATDNYDSDVTVFCDLREGLYLLDNYQVRCNATDVAGNSGNCSFKFNIVDIFPPNVTCPEDINVDTDVGVNTAAVMWDSAVVTDNCCGDDIIVYSNATNITDFYIGVTEILFTAVDCFGNEDECVFNIGVGDNETPILECPPRKVLNADSNCMASTTWMLPNVTDNSGDNLTPVCDYLSGSTFSDYSTIVTCNATDNYDNTGNCTFTITVNDCEAPVLNCSEDLVFDVDDNCTSYVNWTDVAASDNYDSDLTVFCKPTEGIFSFNNYTVNCNATDRAGNTGNCSFSVYMFDFTPPNVVCPENITIDTDVGMKTAIVTWDSAVVADNCCYDNYLSSNYTNGTEFSIGITKVIFLAVDCFGNKDDCVFSINVEDNEPPVLKCPPNQYLRGDSYCMATSTWMLPNVTDNSGDILIPVCDYVNGSTFSEFSRPTIVTCNATDNYENTGNCTFAVTIYDCEAPVLNCSHDLQFEADDSCKSFVNWTDVTATDNYDSNVTVSCNLTEDLKSPNLTCPEDIVVYADASVNTAAVSWNSAVTTDNCCGDIILYSNATNGTYFTIGITDVVYITLDCYGNKNECVFSIIVEDNEAPILGCPLNQNLRGDSGCMATASWMSPNVTDNSRDNLNSVCDYVNGSTFSDYSTIVTCNATDNYDNTGNCTFTVFIYDDTSPKVTCPDDIMVCTAVGIASFNVSWEEANVTENCYDTSPKVTCPDDIMVCTAVGIASFNVSWEEANVTENCCSDVNITTNYTSGNMLTLGVYTVGYAATDCNNNTGYCQFTVEVTDCEPPVVECPLSQNVRGDDNCLANVTWSIPTVTDNSGNSFNAICDYVNGSTFSYFSTIVTCNATDNHDNTDNCTFTIIVYDDEDPVISCPSDIWICALTGYKTTPVTWETINATNYVNITSNYTSGEEFEIGETVVTYTATDCGENSASCNFTVVVLDCEAPVLNCSDLTYNADNSCNSYVNLSGVTASDNYISDVPIFCNQSEGIFSMGNYTVNCNASDTTGNTGNCSFDVYIFDKTAPNITCPDDIRVCTDVNSYSVNVTWEGVNTTDNCCSNISTTSNYSSGDIFYIGVYIVEYTAMDCNGNTGYCQFTVEVEDCEPPVIECPPSQDVTDNENCLANVTWTLPIVTDNSGDTFIPVCDYVNGSTFSYPSTIVTCTANDNYDNIANCTFTIIIIYDGEDPAISCPADIEICAVTGYITSPVFWEPINATGNVEIKSNYSSGEDFKIGETVVRYTATDCRVKSASCAFSIVILDCEAPALNCSDLTFYANEDCQSYVNWTVAVTDNYERDLIVFCNVTQGIFPLGNYTVSCNATDMANNTGTCLFNFYIVDVISPIVKCPDNITIDADVGVNTTTVTWNSAVVNDNCCGDDISSFFNATNGTEFYIGITKVGFTAIDCYGNENKCVFIINVRDKEAPVLECPRNQNLAGDSNCMATATWSSPNVTDNSGDNFIPMCEYLSGNLFSEYSTTVTCSATDNFENTGNCTFNVTIYDDADPVILCPPGIEISTSTGKTTAPVYWEPINATDNCCDVRITSNNTSGELFEIGEYVLTYTATDCNEHQASCNFTIEVLDTENPVILCPIDYNVTTDVGLPTAFIKWNVTYTDNTDVLYDVKLTGPGTRYNHSGETFVIGTTTLEYTATDAFGNNNTCTFVVIVRDAESPVINNCPRNIYVNTTTMLHYANVTWIAPNATDNSGNVTLETTYTSGEGFPLSTTNVVYTATDPYGNTALCSFDVNVIDPEMPLFINCPVNIETNTIPSLSYANVTWHEPTAIDNSGRVNVVQSAYPGNIFGVGTHTVNYTATDVDGNVAECLFTISVSDNERPVFKCNITNVTVEVDFDSLTSTANWTLENATDNVGVVSKTQTHNQSHAFEIGTTVVTYTATDAAGNVGTCSFEVIVLDLIPPVLDCVINVTAYTDPDSATAIVYWMLPTVSDNSGISPTLESNFGPNNRFDIGTHVVIYNSTDGSNNYASCSFNVTVIDNVNPLFHCPKDITKALTDLGKPYSTVFWNVTVTDNSGPVTLNCSRESGDHFNIIWPTVEENVTCVAKDSFDNTALCTFTVTVFDEEYPEINCPDDFNLKTDSGNSTAVIGWEVTYSDNSDSLYAVTVTGSGTRYNQSRTEFPIGITEIEYLAADVSRNNNSCSFIVLVEDVEDPVIIGCPRDIFANTTHLLSYTNVTWIAPTATDNSGSVTLKTNYASGEGFPISTTTVVYTAIDPYGNTVTCSFNVTVIDPEMPRFTKCLTDIQTDTYPGLSYTNVTWTEPTAVDNAGHVIVAQTAYSGDSFNVGNHKVTYTATDEDGNMAECSFTIFVEDNEQPIFNCNITNMTTYVDIDSSTSIINWTLEDATDNVGVISMTLNYNQSHAFEIGTTVVMYTATDAAGNKGICSFEVVVIDNIKPVINCVPNVTVSTDRNSPTANVSWDLPKTYDNSGTNPTLNSNFEPYTLFSIGLTKVMYTATDGSNNTDSCLIEINVIDMEDPILVCPSTLSTETDTRSANAIVTWVIQVEDNSRDFKIMSTHSPGYVFPIGVTTVEYKAQDISGNTAECSFNVIVKDTEKPNLVCPDDVISDIKKNVNWIIPKPEDNSDQTVTLNASASPDDTWELGEHTVIYTATDKSGNVDTCSFMVLVIDACNNNNNCQNGGICLPKNTGFKCLCQTLFKGFFCEIKPKPPVFTVSPKRAEANIQDTVSLTCSSSNSSNWKWYKDNSPIVSTTNLHNITIRITVDNQGYYYCGGFGAGDYSATQKHSNRVLLLVKGK
ncbi:uncharacterized protein LOC117115806 [Anneissia japonica]|uniref:uncharacterized protein LOC117115806 n=1 Tax=Anneissia japonica TaxID=1529436 RepID=UPI001425A1B1|nr:uncharacterized protein LOC117115806 [Anneissia japonica]